MVKNKLLQNTYLSNQKKKKFSKTITIILIKTNVATYTGNVFFGKGCLQKHTSLKKPNLSDDNTASQCLLSGSPVNNTDTFPSF
jgi:hypothetical protein